MLSPKEVVNKWVDAFNDGDVDMIISLYDNNATNHQQKVGQKLSSELAKSCKKNLPVAKGGRVFRISSPKNKT